MTRFANPRRIALGVLLAFAWMKLSEDLRAFLIVMPAVRAYLPTLPGVAPIDPLVFASWTMWEVILLGLNLGVTAVVVERFGTGIRAVLGSATLSWLIFPLFWLGMINFGLSDPRLLLWTMPWSWIELAVSSAIFTSIAATRNVNNVVDNHIMM